MLVDSRCCAEIHWGQTDLPFNPSSTTFLALSASPTSTLDSSEDSVNNCAINEAFVESA